MYPNKPNIFRRFVVLLIGLLFAVAVIVAFYTYVIQPRLTVAAPIGSTITVQDMATGLPISTARATSASTTVRLGSGSYSIMVSSNNSKELRYAGAALFQETKLDFQAPTELNTSLVASQSAYQPVPGTSSLSYLDTANRRVESVDSNGSVTTLVTNVQSYHALAGNQAVVVANNSIYVLNGNQLTPLSTAGF